MNVLDKFIVAKRVKHTLGYTAVVGLVNVLVAALIGLFVDWSGVGLYDLAFPVLAGVLLGAQTFFYFQILEKEDVSHMIGFAYVYPIVVALLAFLFLREQVSLLGYIGMAVTLLGVVLLSIRVRQVRLQVSVLFIVALILTIALNEFFVKVSTGGIGEWQGVVVNNLAFGTTLLCALLFASVRSGFAAEIHNIRWAMLTEVFTFGGVLFLYLAMAQLPATIVSSISALQPLTVLLFERLANQYVGQISRDDLLLPKLGAIALIVLGVVLMYVGI